MLKQPTIIVLLTTIFLVLTSIQAYAVDSFGAQGLLNATTQLQKQASHAAQVQELRLQDVIKRADTMISTRITSLNTLLSRIQNDTRLTTDEKSSLSTNIQTTISGLTNLKTKIDGDTDVTTARTDARQIVTNYYVYEALEPKIRLLIALNNLQTMVSHLQALLPQLQNLINTLQSQGKDTSQLTPLLNDITTQIQTINTTLTTDITTVQNMSTTTNPKTTITQVKQDVQTIVKTDFGKIRTDISQMRSIIRQLILPKHELSATGSARIVPPGTSLTVTHTPQ